MRVLTTRSSPAHAGTLFLPMRISIFVELNEAGGSLVSERTPRFIVQIRLHFILGSTSNGLM
jgi:hypothetical protein